MNNKWSILCPGPSLMRTDLIDAVDDRHVVAVNYALMFTGAYAEYWVMLDPEVFSVSLGPVDIEKVTASTTLFVHWNFEKFGLNKKGGAGWDEDEHRTYKRFDVEHWRNESDIKQFPDSCGEVIAPFATARPVKWNEFSMFVAIALCVKRGAEEIEIYGADLKDAGYFESDIPANKRQDHSKRRWMWERHFFARILAECQKNGVKITRR